MARQFDVHIQLVPADQYTGTRFFGFAFKRSLGVRGLQKLVNMFLLELLTPIGSDPSDLARGTDLPNLLGSNATLEDTRDVLVLSVSAAQKNVMAQQDGAGIPDDERLASVTLQDFYEVPGPGFSAKLLVKNVLGSSLGFLLPTLEVR